MNNKIRILHVDDNQLDRQLVKDALLKEHDLFEIMEADNREKFEKYLSQKNFDLVLSDFNILGFDGLQVLQKVKEKNPDLPVIIVTGTGSEEIAIQAMKMGASDYVIKSVKHIRGLATTIEQVQKNRKINEEREQALNALRHSEEKYRKIFENIQDVFYQVDKQGIILEMSPSVFRFSGYSREEMIGNSILSLYYLKEDRGHVIALMEKMGELWNHEVKMVTKIGQIKYASLNAHFLMNEKNEKIGYEVLLRDVTEQKLMEIELLKAKEKAEEYDKLKTAFLANMSHEIRTPMNGILGFAELLKNPTLTGEKQKEYIRVIEKSGARMLNIINDIVNVSKIESGHIEVNISETNANVQLEDAYVFFKPEVEQKGIQFSLITPFSGKEAVLKTDREKLFAVLSNLIKNSIKFTDSGFIKCGYTKTGKYFQFFVQDTGVGIPRNQVEFIFERFRQGSVELNRNYEGAGLGLSISKSYVEKLGGKIWVESEEGKGSVFYFTLPDNYVTKENIEIESSGKSNTTFDIKNKLKILIAEDDDISRELISTLVEKYSKEIMIAINGKEAVQFCRKQSDIDLVLMDFKMPQMNGYEATKEIRKFNKKVVIVAQTGYVLLGDYEKALQVGCNDYISKPINLDKLLEIIQKYFGSE